MAATLEIEVGLTGLTLTAKLYADGSDTLAATVTLTEATNRLGYYTGPATGLTGLHWLRVLNGTANLATGWAQMAVSGTVVAGGSRLDVLLQGAQSEPGQGAPAANESPLTKLAYLFKAFRNKLTQTSTTFKLYGDDGTTVDHKATTSDDGTTFTREEIGSGP